MLRQTTLKRHHCLSTNLVPRTEVGIDDIKNMATVANAGGFRSGGSATILVPESGPYGLGMSDR